MSKLSYEDKINLYNERKNGCSMRTLSKKYNIAVHGVQYLCCLIDKHGFDILRTTKNRYYPCYVKQNVIDRILVNNESIWSVSLDIGLHGDGLLHSWISKYKENGYNIVERKRGRSPTMPKKESKSKTNETIEEENERLRKENLYLKAKLEFSKKIESRCSSKEESTSEEKVNVVNELQLAYPLVILLQISGLAKSVHSNSWKILREFFNKEKRDNP